MIYIDLTTLHVLQAFTVLACAASFGGALVALASRRRGGIHFWRVGRFGGTFYVARRDAA